MKSQNVFLITILLLAALGIGGCTFLITVQVTKDILFRFIHSLFGRNSEKYFSSTIQYVHRHVRRSLRVGARMTLHAG